MSKNRFGNIYQVTSFGESHGPGIGCIIEGCPAGVTFDLQLLNRELARRRPGGDSYATAGLVSERQEPDAVEILSGVFQGKTLGTPLAFLVRNVDQKSGDYDTIKENPRVGHADDLWKGKYSHIDHRGGGRSSGRETISRVIAGAVAKMIVHHLQPGVDVIGFTEQVDKFSLSLDEIQQVRKGAIAPDDYKMRFPSEQHQQLAEFIKQEKAMGHSYGGTAGFFVKYVPAFLGQPTAHKFKADLAAACLSVGAVNGFELGDTNLSRKTEGSIFHGSKDLDSCMKYGGIRGGMTTGEDIFFRLSFKPTSSVLDIAKKGRHDPCIIPRAIPVIESMCWMVLADHMLWTRTDRI